MHNHWNPALYPPPPGDPIIGKIIDSKVYPYGCVSIEVYNTDKAALENELAKKANLTDLPLIQILDSEPAYHNCIWFKPVTPDELHSEPTILVQEREPDINNCVWFKPYSISPEVLEALLNMNPDTSAAEILSGIGGTDYGVDNATTSEDIPEGVYNFTIF